MAERMGERADPCPTLTLVMNVGDSNPFHAYNINLFEW